MKKIIATLGITGSVIAGGVGTTDAVNCTPSMPPTPHQEVEHQVLQAIE